MNKNNTQKAGTPNGNPQPQTRVHASISKEMLTRLLKCMKSKGLKEGQIIVVALDEYLTKNTF